MVCDLDGFKQVNDRFGHLEGNKVLRSFAQKIREHCRGYDYVARMGGDEFVIVAPGLAHEAAMVRAQEFNTFAIQAGFEVTRENTLTISVGLALFDTDGTDAEQLLAAADIRMYKVKKSSRKSDSNSNVMYTGVAPVVVQ
jgi:diguanylate cyclase (GGDEF)-like protein